MIRPSIKFLFVGAGVCLRLPSDSASRRTPLPLANSSYCKALLRLFDFSHYSLTCVRSSVSVLYQSILIHKKSTSKFFTQKRKWIYFFIEHLTGNDVGLIHSMANKPLRPHFFQKSVHSVSGSVNN